MHSDDLHQRADPVADAARHGQQITLAVVGAGKVGTTLARLLDIHGYRITTVYSRTAAHAQALAQGVNAQAVESLDDLRGDLVLLTVSDDAIRVTAQALTESRFTGSAVVHTSGALDVSVLEPLTQRGLMIGSLHPAYPFADVETALVGLPGSTFAIEAQDDLLLGWLRDLVVALDGQALIIPRGGKALYHAALVLTSNYTVTLYAAAEALLLKLGADRSAADQALNGLLGGTVANLRTQGIPEALTGPLVRADVGTIAAHLKALHEVDERLAEVYRELARLTFPLLQARGIEPDAVEQLLRQDEQDAHYSP